MLIPVLCSLLYLVFRCKYILSCTYVAQTGSYLVTRPDYYTLLRRQLSPPRRARDYVIHKTTPRGLREILQTRQITCAAAAAAAERRHTEP